jgi:hypothetical protein
MCHKVTGDVENSVFLTRTITRQGGSFPQGEAFYILAKIQLL